MELLCESKTVLNFYPKHIKLYVRMQSFGKWNCKAKFVSLGSHVWFNDATLKHSNEICWQNTELFFAVYRAGQNSGP